MNKKLTLWMVPILITVHNIEEALFMPAVIERRNSSIPIALSALLPPVTYKQFLLALFIVTAIPYFVAWYTSRAPEREARVSWLLCLQIIMFINVFAHAGMALLIGGYAPGVVTALAIILPYSIFLLGRALRESWVSKKALVLLGVIGFLLHALVVPGILILAGKLVGNF
jgi:hypothetical protein